MQRFTLRELRRAIQTKTPGMLTNEVVLLHDITRSHTDARTKKFVEDFHLEIFDQAPTYQQSLI